MLFLEFFHVKRQCFWIFIKKNFLLTQILKCLIVNNNLYWNYQQNLVKNLAIHCSFMLLKNNKTFSQKKILSVFNGLPLNTLKLFATKYCVISYQHTWKMFFYFIFFIILRFSDRFFFFFLSIKLIVKSKAFQYLRYKKVFLD